MQSAAFDRLVIDGLAKLSYRSIHLVQHILDVNPSARSNYQVLPCYQHTEILRICNDFNDLNSTLVDAVQNCSFVNKNMSLLLQSALVSGLSSFRISLNEFKTRHKRIFVREINQLDQYGNTLAWYLAKANLFGCIEELFRIISKELNINERCGRTGQTILHHIVLHGTLDELQSLLHMGADPNICDRHGQTALHYLAMYEEKSDDNLSRVQILQEYGVWSNAQDYSNHTSLHHAILSKNYYLTDYLIQLPHVNIALRNKYGYTPVGYLCEEILCVSNSSLQSIESQETLEHRFKTLNLFVDRCPSDQIANQFHIIKNDQVEENLFLHLRDLAMPSLAKNLIDTLNAIIIPTNDDYRSYAKRLLQYRQWKMAIPVLRDTHNVDISESFLRCLAEDLNLPLTKITSIGSDVSLLCTLIFYALATEKRLMTNLISACEANAINEDELCPLYITNPTLHGSYVTLAHTCLHYARLHVYSLKHICRHQIRQRLKSQMMRKIDHYLQLNSKYRDYLTLEELSMIYETLDDLSSMLNLIKRLFNIHQDVPSYSNEHEQSEQWMSSITESEEEVIPPLLNSALRDDATRSVSSSTIITGIEEVVTIETSKPIRQRTIEEIMDDSKISSDISASVMIIDQNDLKDTSHSSTKVSLTDFDLQSYLRRESISSESIDESSDHRFDEELAEMKAKSDDIEKMVDEFLSHK